MAEVLQLQTNVPEVIALQFSDGKAVDGQHGPRVMFTLVDGRRLFTPPIVLDLIKKAAIGKGDRFSICRRETRIDGKDKIQYEVRVGPPTGQPEVSAPQAARQVAQAIQHSNGTTSAFPVNGQGETAVELAMKAAIDVCARGQKYAAVKGLNIAFDGDIVARIMNTIQIGMQERR